MSSSGGARVGGSNLKDEGKFRQRVDEHYKLIASARPKLGFAWKLQTASAVALGAFAAAGVAGVLEPALPDTHVAAHIAYTLVMLWAALNGSALLGMIPTLPVRQNSKYDRICKALVLLIGVTALTPLMFPELLLTRPVALAYEMTSAILGLIGCALGMFATSKLGNAFEQQLAKRRR